MNIAGPMALAIRPGIAISQFIFEGCAGRARYGGRSREPVRP
jgi:hypothetical protein